MELNGVFNDIQIVNGWTWNPDSSTWFYGEDKQGCGVYKDVDRWWANISFYGWIYCIGPFDNSFKAMREAKFRLGNLISEIV
jgi:hypothetical protein